MCTCTMNHKRFIRVYGLSIINEMCNVLLFYFSSISFFHSVVCILFFFTLPFWWTTFGISLCNTFCQYVAQNINDPSNPMDLKKKNWMNSKTNETLFFRLVLTSYYSNKKNPTHLFDMKCTKKAHIRVNMKNDVNDQVAVVWNINSSKIRMLSTICAT